MINTWANNRIDDFRTNYERMGLKASGNWGRELEFKKEETPDKLNIKFYAPAYTEQLVKGRRPNKNQTKDGLKAWVGWAGSTFLKDWVKQKNINANPFAVAWKIAREGWKIPNDHNSGKLLADVLSFNKVKELAQIIGANIEEGLRTEILKK
jgi:hypothetical protein